MLKYYVFVEPFLSSNPYAFWAQWIALRGNMLIKKVYKILPKIKQRELCTIITLEKRNIWGFLLVN